MKFLVGDYLAPTLNSIFGMASALAFRVTAFSEPCTSEMRTPSGQTMGVSGATDANKRHVSTHQLPAYSASASAVQQAPVLSYAKRLFNFPSKRMRKTQKTSASEVPAEEAHVGLIIRWRSRLSVCRLVAEASY